MQPKRIPENRFWAKVDKSGDCWTWTGATYGGFGYGQFRYEGRRQVAHRVSYALFVGPIPAELCVLHRCDNPPCVRPDHLFLGTRADNNHDRDEKGRSRAPYHPNAPRGHAHCKSKLSPQDVASIRSIYASGTTTQAELGRFYGVTQSAISLIVKRRRYA